MRLVGRYLGFTAERSVGVQLGLKFAFATGSFNNDYSAGPQEGEPVDRGLQPGTGTTGLLLGAFAFGSIASIWDWFAQGMLQQPMNSRDGFRPGIGLNANGGFRYVAFEKVIPSLQIYARVEGRESGDSADVVNSGSTLVYVRPGVNFTITEKMRGYLFAQVPVHQRVNGLQFEPRYTVTLGVYYAM